MTLCSQASAVPSQTPHTIQAYLLGCLVEEFLYLRHLGRSHGSGGPGDLENKHQPWSGWLLLSSLLITHLSSVSDVALAEEATLFYFIWKLIPLPLWYPNRSHSSLRGSLCSNRAARKPQLPTALSSLSSFSGRGKVSERTAQLPSL